MSPNFVAKGHTFIVGWFADRTWKIKENGLPIRLKFRVICILYTQFRDVATGLFIQLGGPYAAHGPRFGDLWSKPWQGL